MNDDPSECAVPQPMYPDSLKCPVCMDMFFTPTLFGCGHTLCLKCHYEIDKNTPSTTFDVPIYKCPLCRHTSIVPWNKRKLNITLAEICRTHAPEEYARLETASPPPPPSPPGLTDSSVNLSRLAADARKEKAKCLYDTLIPLMINAARDGKSFLIIKEKKTVRDIEICLQPLTKMLFRENNVYKLICSPEECTILFAMSAARWRREVINTTHTPAATTDDETDGTEETNAPTSSAREPLVRTPPARRLRNRRTGGITTIRRLDNTELEPAFNRLRTFMRLYDE